MTFFISPPFGEYISTNYTTSIRGSFTLYPREGLLTRIFLTLRYSLKYGGWTNDIGLRNKGIDYALQTYKEDQVISIAILEKSDIEHLLKKIPPSVNLEINISCPNAPVVFSRELAKFLNNERRWCILKVSPRIDPSDINEYYDRGFRQFHFSNTYPLSDLGYESGGVSGEFVKKHNSYLIPLIKHSFPDIEIIAGGGIRNGEDIEWYGKLGASHFSFSTVHFNPFVTFFLYRTIRNWNQ
jgi:dihydroorotate dehydrogenase